jgi:hypothetical protein
MAKLLQKAINSHDGDRATKIIQEAPSIAFEDVPNYVFPKT